MLIDKGGARRSHLLCKQALTLSYPKTGEAGKARGLCQLCHRARQSCFNALRPNSADLLVNGLPEISIIGVRLARIGNGSPSHTRFYDFIFTHTIVPGQHTTDASGPYAKQPAGAKALDRIFGLKPRRSHIWPYVDSGHVAMEQRPLHLNRPVAQRKLQLSFLFSPRHLVDKYSVFEFERSAITEFLQAR